MAKLADLRKKAKGMGIAPSKIRGATTASELQAVIAKAEGSSTVVRKKARKKSAVRSTGSTKRRAARPATRGSKSAPARSRGTAKRQTAATRNTRKRTNTRRNDTGRNMLNGVDFTYTEGWNAREGSAPDRIIKALRKYRGNRDKVFTFLADDVWDFVGKTKRNGEKRTRAEALDMLAYRISRTAWEFAVRTEQHDPSENRVQYGTGGTGEGVWKPAGKRGSQKRSAAPKRRTAKRATAKRGTSQKRSQGRKRGTTKRRAARR